MVKKVEVLLKSAVINFEIDKNKENKIKIEKNTFLGNQKRRTHHRYAFSPRGFERKQLIRILCEHKCALIFTLVADDLTNRCWVLTKTRSFYSLIKKRYASKTITNSQPVPDLKSRKNVFFSGIVDYMTSVSEWCGASMP